MAGNMAKDAATEEVEMQMTPMIDVTFLLLIFFMCSIKFKLLDGKLAAYLPRDVGVNATPLQMELEKIDINLYLKEGSRLGFTIQVNEKNMKDLLALHNAVKTLHDRDPELKATVYAHKGIQYGHVVKVVNECLRADCNQITFGGTRMDE